MKSLILLLITVSTLLVSFSDLSAQQCVVVEETRFIDTYPFSDPDPVPILVRRPVIYPYFAFNGYSHTPSPQKWQVVRLENDYLRVFVLPAVGGKVYGAIEKSTREEFVYLNSVLKFRQIALRGPWTSGGSEFNFGIVGHTPATATPVDYALRQNPDGSVSCIVGTLDLPSRTRWSVEVRLPEDKAFFEMRSLWYNPSPFHQSYYVWTNNAVRTGDDLHYFYPGRYVVPHGYSTPLRTWPVDEEGRDLSWYRNNNFGGSKSHFVLGEYENWYGGYWDDTDFGFGHWALYDDMPGKKMWIWALSPQGAIWEQLLTDTDGQYSEPQAGRLFSQSDHEFFTPYSGDGWREILFPFKEIGGLVEASPYGAMNIHRDGESLQVGICALQALDDDLVVLLDGEEIYRQRLVMGPMDVYQEDIDLPSSGGRLEISVAKKLNYSDDPLANDVNRPLNFRRHDESTAEGLYLSGEFYEKQRRFDVALNKYLACVEREPLHGRALTRVAELYCRRAEYEKALDYATRALDNVMYDADANYAYGVISRYLGNNVDAKETLGWAARSLKYRSNAYCQMAEIHIKEGNPELARDYARRALDFNKYNLRAYEVLGIAHRILGQPDMAWEVINELLEIDPLNHLARFELYLLEPAGERLQSFYSMIRSELPYEHYLEVAISYYRLGLDREAVAALREAPEYPTVYYWLAYLLRNVSAEQSRAYLEKADRLSPRLVFPFREETIPILQWAGQAQPDDWKSGYYLGLIYWGKGRVEEARQLFRACGKVDFAPLYLILGHLERERAVSHFAQALAVDDTDWRNWHYLVDRYNQLARFGEALELSERAVRRFPDEIFISMDYASSLFNNGRYSQCLSLLENLEVLPYEGGWEVHDLFMRTQIHLAMEGMNEGSYRQAVRHLEGSKAYPEHLGTGAPYDADFRLQDYLAASCFENMDDRKSAAEIRERIRDYTLHKWTEGGSFHYFGLLALKDMGEDEKAEELVKDLESRFPDNLDVQWAVAKFIGNIQKAEDIERSRGNDPRFRIMWAAVRLIEGNR